MGKLMFTVPGTPKGKGRPRATVRGGHAAMYTPAPTAIYENLVKMTAQEAATKAGVGVIDQSVAIVIVVKFQPPKSWSKKKQKGATHFSADMSGGKFFGYPVDSRFLFHVENLEQALLNLKLLAGGEFAKHSSRPDVDNIAKAILDGINGSLLADDSQVWTVVAAKIYSETPGVDVGVFWGVGTERSSLDKEVLP